MSVNWLQLSHRTAIITGAGSGIGSAIAKAFAGQGCNVLLVDKHIENVKKMRNECREILQQQQVGNFRQYQHWSEYLVADMTNKNQVCNMIDYADSMVEESYKNDDSLERSASILVNAAGITKDGLIQNISELDYDKVLDTNLKGTFLACQAFCNNKRLDRILGLDEDHRSQNNEKEERSTSTVGNSASIVNIGSIISEQGNVGQTNYAASKGGVVGLTRALAKEMAFYTTNRAKTIEADQNYQNDSIDHIERSNIRVNAILPGFIHTPMSEAVPDRVKERIKNQIPLKEFGTVNDIANMALFLASSRSSYVTGTTLECSGMIAI